MRHLLFALTLGLFPTLGFSFEVDNRQLFMAEPGSQILKVISTADLDLFAGVIDVFQSRYPSVSVDYYEVGSTELVKALIEDGAQFDLAVSSAMDLQTKLWPTLFTEREQYYLDRLKPTVARLEATIFFSAKESFYKCQYPLTKSWVGFQDVELERLEDNLLRPSPTTGTNQPWHASPIYVDSVDEQHIATLTLFHG